MPTKILRALLLACLATSTLFAAKPERPNIVFIYADDLGYGDVGCYGATRVQTPNLDKLAKQGLRFTDAHATSATCTPSRYAVLTGEYPWRKKGTGILPGDAGLIIEPGRTTLPALLQQAGYTTGAVGKWHLGLGLDKIDWNADIKPGPLEIGFNYAFILPATGDRVPCVYVENHRVVGLDPKDPLLVDYEKKIGDEPTGRENPELLKMKLKRGHDQTIVNGISRIGYMAGAKAARWSDEDMADTLAQKAVQFIEKNQKGPFFLYFATHDIHVPRVPHPRFRNRSGLGVRGDVIEEFDWTVGEVMQALDRLKLTKNTLLIVSSDNGPVVQDGYDDGATEALGDHQPAGPWRGGKYSLFEGGTRVPFLVRWPQRVKPGVSGALVSQIDFLASFAALTGQKLAAGTAPDSEDVLSALLGKDVAGRDSLVEHAYGLGWREGHWKFIPAATGKRAANHDPDSGLALTDQLYDLSADPGEQHNLASAQPERVKDLAAKLEAVKK